jgi:hypothetical protein
MIFLTVYFSWCAFHWQHTVGAAEIIPHRPGWKKSKDRGQKSKHFPFSIDNFSFGIGGIRANQ